MFLILRLIKNPLKKMIKIVLILFCSFQLIVSEQQQKVELEEPPLTVVKSIQPIIKNAKELYDTLKQCEENVCRRYLKNENNKLVNV